MVGVDGYAALWNDSESPSLNPFYVSGGEMQDILKVTMRYNV